MILEYMEDNLRVVFRYSSYYEMIGSLHVLCKPDHHTSRSNWVDNMNDKLDQKTKNLIDQYGDLTDIFLGPIGVIGLESLWDASILEVIDYIRNMDTFEFLKEIFNGRIEDEDIKMGMILEKVRRTLDDKYKEVLKNPKEFQDQFCDFLTQYYITYFSEEITRAEAYIIRRLKQAFDQCKRIGAYTFVHQLHPRIEVVEEKINFHKYKLFEIKKEELGTLLIDMDTFVHPHLLIGIDGENLHLIFPIPMDTVDIMPKDTVQYFKCFADENRLKIMKHLYSQAMSTQQLSDRLNISEAAVSKHLKMMHQSHLVHKVRDGNYIMYHLNQHVMDSSLMYLYETIV